MKELLNNIWNAKQEEVIHFIGYTMLIIIGLFTVMAMVMRWRYNRFKKRSHEHWNEFKKRR